MPRLEKPKALLIKAHGRSYVRNCEHGRDGSVLFLVKRVDFLRHAVSFHKRETF